DDPESHHNLSILLWDQGRLKDAEAALRKAIALNPNDPRFCFDLGKLVGDIGRPTEAVKWYRRAIELKPDFAEAHCNLGLALKSKAHYSEAVAELRMGHELGSKRKDWKYPSAEWVREAERFVALDKNLQAFLSGAAQPNDAEESLMLAVICHHQ